MSADHDGWFGHLSHEHSLRTLLRHSMVPVLVVRSTSAAAPNDEAA